MEVFKVDTLASSRHDHDFRQPQGFLVSDFLKSPSFEMQIPCLLAKTSYYFGWLQPFSRASSELSPKNQDLYRIYTSHA